MFLLIKSTASPVIIRQTTWTSLTKNLPSLWQMLSQQYSGLPPLKKEKINNNLQLNSIQEESSFTRPLILLFGWMLAKQRHLDKYANLYHSKGFDVLCLQMRPTQVLIPHRAQKTVETLLSLLSDSSLSQKPLMVHGFSVGGYMYGECLVKLSQERDRHQGVRDRLAGQIFDSPVDFGGIASGFSSVLTNNRLGQVAIRTIIETYLNVLRGPVKSHFLLASQAFHDNEMRLPSLMLYSKSDPIGVAAPIELVMRKWQQENIPVSYRCWDTSPHVSHFHRHPDEYVEAVLAFVRSIGLSQHETQQVKEAQAI